MDKPEVDEPSYTLTAATCDSHKVGTTEEKVNVTIGPENRSLYEVVTTISLYDCLRKGLSWIRSTFDKEAEQNHEPTIYGFLRRWCSQ